MGLLDLCAEGKVQKAEMAAWVEYTPEAVGSGAPSSRLMAQACRPGASWPVRATYSV